VQAPQPGFFYLIDHGPGANGETLWILDPRVPAVTAAPQLLTNWEVFDQHPGIEHLWLLWSEKPIQPLLAALRASPTGEVRDPSAVQQILHYLTSLPPAAATAGQNGVQLRAAGDVVGAPLELRHQ